MPHSSDMTPTQPFHFNLSIGLTFRPFSLFKTIRAYQGAWQWNQAVRECIMVNDVKIQIMADSNTANTGGVSIDSCCIIDSTTNNSFVVKINLAEEWSINLPLLFWNQSPVFLCHLYFIFTLLKVQMIEITNFFTIIKRSVLWYKHLKMCYSLKEWSAYES